MQAASSGLRAAGHAPAAPLRRTCCSGSRPRRLTVAAAASPRPPIGGGNGSNGDSDGGGEESLGQRPASPPPTPGALLRGLASRLEASLPPRYRAGGSSSSSSSNGNGSDGGYGGGSSGGGATPASSRASPLASFDPEEATAASAAAAREAFAAGTLGFGFSAGGLLFPYYCGVVSELTSSGVIREATQLAGASAGSLIVACARSGLPMSTITEACYALADDCRTNGTRFRLGPVLEGVLRELLPDNVADSVGGRTFVAVTRVGLPPGAGPLLAPRLVSEFEGRDDLISALLTSCHIPVYLDGRLTTTFRGAPHFDGGITNFLPSPGGASHTVRVCCLPSKQLAALGPIDVAPDVYCRWPYSLRDMLAWAFEPADQGMLEELVERGRADARSWADASGVGALAAAELAASKAAGDTGAGAVVAGAPATRPRDGLVLP